MPDELTKALLLEEAASEDAIADALFASVTGGAPLVQALLEARAVSPEVLARYLARTEAPYLRQVLPLVELVDRLPPGLCARLLAIPVRRDAITGTIDVVVADAGDPHPGNEIAYHLGAPVRLVRATPAAIEEGLRKLRSRSLPPSRPEAADPRDDERLYDSRPRASDARSFKGGTLPPPALKVGYPSHALDAMASDALRPSRMPASERQAHVVPAGPSGRPAALGRSRDTPPWGTPVHNATTQAATSEHPTSGLGSEIPIPLTRRTFTAVSGGTQRPPPLVDPAGSALGEGYPVDPAHFRQIVEVNERMRPAVDGPAAAALGGRPLPGGATGSFIPGPPPLPGGGAFGAYAPQVPSADTGGILAALRAAGSRDEVLELVLTGARIVAFKVALFVVKRGGYLGWACTPEFADRAALQSILIPLESTSVFDDAVREGLYLGPIRHDDVHASLLHVMRGASRDVAVVPIRVSGKTAVVLVADELGDTMLATRRLEELARAAGDAFARIVRMRR
ncbi:MAG: FrgA [Labilithrix sp.]|nr:FrgA [Labilithrix sp.]